MIGYYQLLINYNTGLTSTIHDAVLIYEIDLSGKLVKDKTKSFSIVTYVLIP